MLAHVPGDTRCLVRSLVLTRLLARARHLRHARDRRAARAGLPGPRVGRARRRTGAGPGRRVIRQAGRTLESHESDRLRAGRRIGRAPAIPAGRGARRRPAGAWPPPSSCWALPGPRTPTLVCDERRPDGSVLFQIEEHPERRLPDPRPRLRHPHRSHATDSRSSRRPRACQDAAWQRLLVAQVLPFAALLRGLEVFHASGVVLGGEAIALLGPSHSGKTSLAMELCDLGASFLADDVLALEVADGRPASPPWGAGRRRRPRCDRAPRGGARERRARAHHPRARARASPRRWVRCSSSTAARTAQRTRSSSPRPTPRCCSRRPSTSCSPRPIGCRACWRSARWRRHSPSSGS